MRYLITCGGLFARANAHFERILGIQILGGFWARVQRARALFSKGPRERARARLCPPLGAGKSKEAFLRRRPFFSRGPGGNPKKT
jgi:hypothetical protein